MNSLRYTAVLCSLMLLATGAQAQGGKKSHRDRTVESSFVLKYQDSTSIEYEGGSGVDVGDDFGWGFRFGFNHTARLNVGFQFDWVSSPYTAYLVPADEVTDPTTIRHKMDLWSGTVKGVYHFSEKRFTPYIEAGLGWATIDSNIASEPPTTGCWWHPWWGYICETWQSSYSDTSFAYDIGVGLRFEMTDTTFVRASVSNRWIDSDFATSSPSFYTTQIEIGAMIWD